MRKLSKRQIAPKRLSKRAEIDIDDLIDKMRKIVKEDPEIRKKFEEYDVNLDEIDQVPITFCDLDVSAKTKGKKIYLNKAMLTDDSPVNDPTGYLVHEIVHFLQQLTGKNMDKNKDSDDYLDKFTEEEAFKEQIDFKKRKEGEEEAESYTEQLLSHHDLKGRKREEKKKELLDE